MEQKRWLHSPVTTVDLKLTIFLQKEQDSASIIAGMRKGCVQWSLSEAEGDFIEAGVGWEDIVRISWLNEIAIAIE